MGGVLQDTRKEDQHTAKIQKAINQKIADEEKMAAIDRQQRGVYSNIRTSERGVPDTEDLKRKNLLGE